MNTITPDPDFSLPSRQSRAAIVIFVLKFVNNTFRKGWAALVPIFIALRKFSLEDWQIYLLATVIVLIYISFSYLSYQRFYYYIMGDEIIIEEGVLYRTKTSLPFDKVQTINFKQNILQQVLGVLTLQIDSAGSSKQEINLEALKENRAKQFRDYILDRKEKVAPSGTLEKRIAESGSDREEDVDEKRKEKTLLHLKPIDLIKIGISQNHLRSIAIFGAFVWNTYAQLKEQLDFDEDEKIDQLTGIIGSEWLGRLGLLIAVALILSLIVSLGITFFRNFNFRLTETSDGIKKRYGLMERHEQSTTLRKIQSISWGDNLIKKIFGLFVFRMYPAASNELSRKKTISVPGSYQKHVNALIDLIFGEQAAVDYSRHRMSKFFIQRTTLFFGLLPAVLLAIVTYFFWGPYSAFFLLWFPLALAATIVYYKKWMLYISEEVVRIQYGVFSHQNKMIRLSKVQAVRLSQSPFQKRKNLAALDLYSAGRNFSFSYISYELALQLQNYILYKVESSTDKWM
ncbi:PH domain-containing protein [Fulvivirgaceae bacterium BMA12]|uniref:PH domain-containing protein n=1 Tax=Agaribacillus aureus TaxID=3051825 RepID=A0ABT8L471_9BACT|nr:PH domain-containing protein [Fulvivirgaceae bacterium BMA12]